MRKWVCITRNLHVPLSLFKLLPFLYFCSLLVFIYQAGFYILTLPLPRNSPGLSQELVKCFVSPHKASTFFARTVGKNWQRISNKVHKGNLRLAEPAEKHRNLRALGTLAVDISTTLIACRHLRHLIRSHTSSSRLTLHSIYHSTSTQIPRVLVFWCAACRVAWPFSVLRGCFPIGCCGFAPPSFPCIQWTI